MSLCNLIWFGFVWFGLWASILSSFCDLRDLNFWQLELVYVTSFFPKQLSNGKNIPRWFLMLGWVRLSDCRRLLPPCLGDYRPYKNPMLNQPGFDGLGWDWQRILRTTLESWLLDQDKPKNAFVRPVLLIASFLQNLRIHRMIAFSIFFHRIPNCSCSWCLDSHSFPQSSTLSKHSLGKCLYMKVSFYSTKKDSNIWVADQLLQSHLSGFPNSNWRSHFRSPKKGIPRNRLWDMNAIQMHPCIMRFQWTQWTLDMFPLPSATSNRKRWFEMPRRRPC